MYAPCGGGSVLSRFIYVCDYMYRRISRCVRFGYRRRLPLRLLEEKRGAKTSPWWRLGWLFSLAWCWLSKNAVRWVSLLEGSRRTAQTKRPKQKEAKEATSKACGQVKSTSETTPKKKLMKLINTFHPTLHKPVHTTHKFFLMKHRVVS